MTQSKQFNRHSLLHEIVLLLRFFKELFKGVIKFRRIAGCITIYGSAQFSSDNPHYQKAMLMGRKIAQAGYTVMTGGGPGIMEAANKGAHSIGHHYSAGCTIRLIHEERPNPYLKTYIKSRYFFIRKLMLTKYSLGFIAFPGGFGTLDELFEIITLVKTQHIENFPVVLIGKDFWQPLLDFLKNTLVQYKTIGAQDIENILFLTDSLEEAIEHIKWKIQHASYNEEAL